MIISHLKGFVPGAWVKLQALPWVAYMDEQTISQNKKQKENKEQEKVGKTSRDFPPAFSSLRLQFLSYYYYAAGISRMAFDNETSILSVRKQLQLRCRPTTKTQYSSE